MDKYNESFINSVKYPYLIPSTTTPQYFKIGSMMVQNISTARGCTFELSFIGLFPPNFQRTKTIRFNVGLSFYGNSAGDTIRINYAYDTRESNSFTSSLTDISFDTSMIQFVAKQIMSSPFSLYQVDVYVRSDTLVTLGMAIKSIVTVKSEFIVSKTMNVPLSALPTSTFPLDIQYCDLNKLNTTYVIQQTGVGFNSSYGALSVITDYVKRKREYVGRVQLTSGQTLSNFIIDSGLPVPVNTNQNMLFVVACEFSDTVAYGSAVVQLTTTGSLILKSVSNSNIGNTTSGITALHLTGVSYYF